MTRDETLSEYRYLGKTDSVLSIQGRGPSSASTLGTDWPSHVELGTRLFESIDTWGKMVQFCVTRDEAIPEHRYLGKAGCVK